MSAMSGASAMMTTAYNKIKVERTIPGLALSVIKRIKYDAATQH